MQLKKIKLILIFSCLAITAKVVAEAVAADFSNQQLFAFKEADGDYPVDDFPVNEKEMIEQINQFFAAMSPTEKEEFLEVTQSVAQELDEYVEVEAQKLGISSEEYFEKEFSFDKLPVLLAQNEPTPGAAISESSFQIPTTSSKHATNQTTVATKNTITSKPSMPDTPVVAAPAIVTNSPDKDSANNYGNWLKKAYYLKEAQKIVLASADNLLAIQQKRTDFYAKLVQEIDVAVDDFFRKVGVQRGNFVGMVEYLDTVIGQKIDALAMIEKEMAGKSEAVDLLLYQIEERVDTLKVEQQSLKNDMEALVDLDKKAFDQLEVIDKHIASANAAAEEMYKDVDAIDQTYSHLLAYDLYNKVEANADKIKAIHKYLHDTAPASFEKIKEAILGNLSKFEERVTKAGDEANKLLEKMEKNTASLVKDDAGFKVNKNAEARPLIVRPVQSWWEWLLSFFF
jgi:hypothetical protein